MLRIGVDLGGTKIEIVVLDHAGKSLLRRRIATPQGDYVGTVQAVCTLVQGAVAALAEDTAGDLEDIPVGIGIPGAISPKTGLIKNANSTCLIGHDLAGDLSYSLQRPVRLANDADCFTLSEAVDGAAKGARIVFGAILGTGVGGGLVVDGRLLVGPNAITGEWGHNPLPSPKNSEQPGPECYCGRYGCIETFLSGSGLASTYRGMASLDRQPIEIVALATHNDAMAARALACYEERLARALATIINVIDPHVIVLGGGLSNINRIYKNVPELWQSYVFSDHVDTQLVPAAFGDSSGVRGAAWLW